MNTATIGPQAMRDLRETPEGRAIRIVGAGAAGINLLDEWILLSDSPAGSLACDGEASSVEGSLAAEKLVLAPDLVGGLGCFGSRDLAWRMVGQENQRLDHFLNGCSRLLILTGLAGATGATVAEALSLKAVEREIPTTVFAFLPFPFEAEERQAAAKATREEFPVEASVFLFPSLVLEEPLPGVAAVRRGLREVHGSIAQWIDVWSGITQGRVLGLSGGGGRESAPFEEGGEIENCRVFLSTGDRLDLSLLEFLDGSGFRQAAENADRCLAYAEGDEELTGWEQALAERLEGHLPKGACLSLLRRTEARPPGGNRLLLLVGRSVSRVRGPARAGEASDEAEAEPAAGPIRSRALPEPAGRIVPAAMEGTPFAKTAATVYKGENLDIPAFRRRSGSRLARE